MATIQQDMERIAESTIGWMRKVASGDESGAGFFERIAPVLIVRSSF
ncbi:MAG: hypothetical protein WEB60_11765 [Terrimicrobiaceae bacterium]